MRNDRTVRTRSRALTAFVLEQRYDALAQRLYDRGRDDLGDIALRRRSYNRCTYVLATSMDANGVSASSFPLLQGGGR